MKPPNGIQMPLSKNSTPSHPGLVACLLLALTACVGLTGCFGFLKPSPSTGRHFVLTPLPAGDPPAALSGTKAFGIGQVRLPGYLFNTSLAVRKGGNEIEYSQSALWAERLDSGIQRVLASNMSALLHTDKVRVSSWRSEDVSAEVYVSVEQFDVDAGGEGVLLARWRILAPGGEKLLRSGESRFKRNGPQPEKDPSGAVATLSELITDLSRQLAQALGEATPNR